MPLNGWFCRVYTPFLNPWWWAHDTVWVQVCYGSSWYIRVASLYGHVKKALPLKTYWLLVPGWPYASLAYLPTVHLPKPLPGRNLGGLLVWPTAGRQWEPGEGMRMFLPMFRTSRAWACLDLLVGSLWRGFPEFRSKQTCWVPRIQSCEVFLILVRWSSLVFYRQRLGEARKVEGDWDTSWR